MSDATLPQAGSGSQVRTLAVRISDDVRAQLDIIAQLTERTLTEEIRLAIEFWIERCKSDPEVLKKAETVRADIEREAQVKSHAIDAIFASTPSKTKANSARPTAAAAGSN